MIEIELCRVIERVRVGGVRGFFNRGEIVMKLVVLNMFGVFCVLFVGIDVRMMKFIEDGFMMFID